MESSDGGLATGAGRANGPNLVTSRANKRISAIRRLRGRRGRDETGLFWAEGIRVVIEAVKAGAMIETLVVAPELLRSEVAKEAVSACRARGVECLEVSADVFASLSDKEGPQGLGAVVRQRWASLPASGGRGGGADQGGGSGCGAAKPASPLGSPLWVALDSVQDPGNLGTIIRTTDAVGGTGVALTGRTTDPYDPTSVRASMGSLFAIEIARADFADLVAWARRENLGLIGTSGSAAAGYASSEAISLYRRPAVLLMGGEREGLSSEQQAACDLVVRLPMIGRCDSLNLAVATGVMLYRILESRSPGATLGAPRPG